MLLLFFFLPCEYFANFVNDSEENTLQTLFNNSEGYSRKKYLGGEDGRRYIFLWVVGAESFQIIWVIGFRQNLITWVVGVSPNRIMRVVGVSIYSFAKLKKLDFTCH